MTLATVAPDGRPSARMVICRGIDVRAGWIVFYTDRESAKGKALDVNPYAALVFNWDAHERQGLLILGLRYCIVSGKRKKVAQFYPCTTVGNRAADAERMSEDTLQRGDRLVLEALHRPKGNQRAGEPQGSLRIARRHLAPLLQHARPLRPASVPELRIVIPVATVSPRRRHINIFLHWWRPCQAPLGLNLLGKAD